MIEITISCGINMKITKPGGGGASGSTAVVNSVLILPLAPFSKYVCCCCSAGTRAGEVTEAENKAAALVAHDTPDKWWLTSGEMRQTAQKQNWPSVTLKRQKTITTGQHVIIFCLFLVFLKTWNKEKKVFSLQNICVVQKGRTCGTLHHTQARTAEVNREEQGRDNSHSARSACYSNSSGFLFVGYQRFVMEPESLWHQ